MMSAMSSNDDSSTPSTTPTGPATSATPSTKARVATDEAYRKIDEEMDAAFHRNVAKSRADREARKADKAKKT